MDMQSNDVVDMVGHDCAWAAELMQKRRNNYASYSPVFWHQSPKAKSLHVESLHHQIVRENIIARRTGHGFIIAELRHLQGFVDDFAVDEDSRWDDEGRELLFNAWHRLIAKGATSLTIVSAKRDEAKNRLIDSVGLSLIQQWWVKSVMPTGDDKRQDGPIEDKGFNGYLGPTPPIYDPGGSVLLIRDIKDKTSLEDIEKQGSRWGAVLIVVSQTPNSPRIGELEKKGYEVAPEWFAGKPS